MQENNDIESQNKAKLKELLPFLEMDANEFDLDWIGLIRKFLDRIKTISITAVVFALIAFAYSLVRPITYTSEVQIAPEYQARQSSSSNLGSLTSMLGISTGSTSSADALNYSMFPVISKSTPFLSEFLDMEVTPYAASDEVAKPAVKIFDLLFKKNYKEKVKEFFTGEPDLTAEEFRAKYERRVTNALKMLIDTKMDNRNGVTTISVTYKDKAIARQIAEIACIKFQEYIIDYRTKKAQTDLEYYNKMTEEYHQKMIEAQNTYAKSVDNGRDVVLQSVRAERERLQSEAQMASQLYNQMAVQKATTEAKLQELKPVFVVIQPALNATSPDGFKTPILMVIFAIVGFFLSTIWEVLLKEPTKIIIHKIFSKEQEN